MAKGLPARIASQPAAGAPGIAAATALATATITTQCNATANGGVAKLLHPKMQLAMLASCCAASPQHLNFPR